MIAKLSNNSVKSKSISSISIPPPKARLKAKLSIVERVKITKISRYKTIKELIEYITLDEQLIKSTAKARALKKNESITAYKEYRDNNLSGFISGEFSYRKDDSCLSYLPLLIFDIDNIESEVITNWMIDECKNIPEIFLAFPSLGGQGLRIFIWANSTFESHKSIYKTICGYLESKLNLDGKVNGKIDTSCSNPSRFFFMNHVSIQDLYLNENSKIYSTPLVEDKTILKTTKKTIPVKKLVPISESEKIRLCKLSVDKANGTPDGRNNYVFSLACKMWEHGLSEQSILNECLSLQEESFSTAEIKKTVKSAIKKATFGRFSDEQLLSYKNKIEGNPKEKLQKSKIVKLPKEKEKISFEGDNKFLKIENFVEKHYSLRRNVISHDIESKLPNGEYKVFNESDLEIKLLRGGLVGIKEPINALLGSSSIKDYNPFNDYFENLPAWNINKPDYITQLADYVNAEDQDWFNIQFKKMLVRSLACALGRIPFNKQCFTLVGNQNDGKTSFLRFLCPPKLSNYIKDNPFFGNKDGLLTLVQNLFINLDELANISKYDINQIKKIFTMDCVKERLPYARKPETFKRRASFLASTNSGEFLTDPTGNVRWLIFNINGIQHDNGGKNGYNQNIDIDLVWSQAYSLLESGFEFRMTKEDFKKSEANNKNFQVTMIESELIQERFLPSDKNNPKSSFWTTSKIHKELSVRTTLKITTRSLGIALRSLGYERVNKFVKHDENGKKINQQRKGYYLIDLKS